MARESSIAKGDDPRQKRHDMIPLSRAELSAPPSRAGTSEAGTSVSDAAATDYEERKKAFFTMQRRLAAARHEADQLTAFFALLASRQHLSTVRESSLGAVPTKLGGVRLNPNLTYPRMTFLCRWPTSHIFVPQPHRGAGHSPHPQKFP